MTVLELRKILEHYGANRIVTVTPNHLHVHLEDGHSDPIYIDPTAPMEHVARQLIPQHFPEEEVSSPVAKSKGKMPMKKGGKKGC